MSDKYQKRYLEHQKKKKKQLLKILKNRGSCRIFDASKKITLKNLKKIKKASKYSPTSCDRHGIIIVEISDKIDKDLLTGLLVGGIGWIHTADKILLLFADMKAYKSPYEKDFMPYLDAGCLVQTMWLTAESMSIGMSYINPNIKDKNKKIFNERFGATNHLFCGAIALGYEL